VTFQELQELAIGTLIGLGATTVFLLALWIGFCVLAGFPKLRPTSRKTRVVRTLDERVGEAHTRFLPPDAPRGPVDQLRTPELLEAAARKGA
jgi:hypothetical protein